MRHDLFKRAKVCIKLRFSIGAGLGMERTKRGIPNRRGVDLLRSLFPSAVWEKDGIYEQDVNIWGVSLTLGVPFDIMKQQR